MAISEINDKSLAASAVTATKLATSAVDLTSNKVTGILPVANTVANLSPGNNLIINGAMQVAQRGTSATGIGASDNNFPCVDRMKVRSELSAGRATVSQVADGPSGFTKCLKFACTTTDTSIAAGETFFLTLLIEGQDLQQLKKGTSDAESVTLSFYVKGNASATYTLEMKDQDNGRINTQTFAVTTSWNKISLTFIPDTTGAFDDDNLASLQVNLWLHAGSTYTGGTFASNTWASEVQANRVSSSSTSFLDSTNRTFFITGVQLEVGTVATPFNHRSYGQELALCQRYYYQPTSRFYPGVDNAPGAGRNYVIFPVTMRSAPSVTQASISAGTLGTIWTGIDVHNYEFSAARPGIGLVTPYKFDAEL